MSGTYLVTGGSGGIGLELVKQLVERGATVYATVRSRKPDDAIGKISGSGKLNIIEGVDVGEDACVPVLTAAMEGVAIDVIINNAGVVGTSNPGSGDQSLGKVTTSSMLSAFQVNACGILRVHESVGGLVKEQGGKVAVISTGMGSIGGNNDGGMYAYRTSKAACNMIMKGMSCDLKGKGIAVCGINPGLVASGFGGGMAKAMGGNAVDGVVKGLLKTIDGLDMEKTGCYVTAPYTSDNDTEEPKPLSKGW